MPTGTPAPPPLPPHHPSLRGPLPTSEAPTCPGLCPTRPLLCPFPPHPPPTLPPLCRHYKQRPRHKLKCPIMRLGLPVLGTVFPSRAAGTASRAWPVETSRRRAGSLGGGAQGGSGRCSRWCFVCLRDPAGACLECADPLTRHAWRALLSPRWLQRWAGLGYPAQPLNAAAAAHPSAPGG